jgi:hypothetical protein
MRLAARRKDAKGPRRQISAEFYPGVRLRCILSRRSTVPCALRGTGWPPGASGRSTGDRPGVAGVPGIRVAVGGRCVVTASGQFDYLPAGISGLGLAVVEYGCWRRCRMVCVQGVWWRPTRRIKMRFDEHPAAGPAIDRPWCPVESSRHDEVVRWHASLNPAARRIRRRRRARAKAASIRTTMTETYDVIVAGGGFGGVAAALATGHAAVIAAAHTADTGAPRPQPSARSSTGRTHACSNPRPARTPTTAVTWSLRYR